jgi:hypothetical protein
VPEDETPALPVEIGVEPEAEFAQVTQQVESDTLEALLPASEPSEPLPEVVSEAVAAEDVEEEAEEQAVEQQAEMIPSMPVLMEDDLLFWEFAPRSQADETTESVATEAEEAKLPDEVPLALTPSFSEAISFLSAPEVLASSSQVSALYMTPPLTVTFDGVAEEHAVVETEPDPEVFPEETAFSEEEETWSPPEESDEIPDAVDAEAAMGAAEALLSDTGIVETAEQTGDDEAASYPLSDTEVVDVAENAVETPLPEPEALLEETAFSEEETWSPPEESDEALDVVDAEAAMSMAEAQALLTDTEIVETAEHDDAAETPLPESEVLLEETAFSEEETWSPPEGSDEALDAVDAEAAMSMAEAQALLSDTGTVETAEHDDEAASYPLSDAEIVEVVEGAAEIPLPEPVAGFWYLVEEPEDSQEMESEASEAAVEIEEDVAEETGFSEAEPEALQEIEGKEAEEKAKEVGLTEREPTETEGEEFVMSSVAEEWADGIDDEFVEPEIFESLAEALIEAETDEHPGTDVAVIEETVSGAAPEEMVAETPVPGKTASVSAAALLSERQQQGDETKIFSPRYSAAQLLIAYQRQNPQTQNVKAVPPAHTAVSSTRALAEEHDSLLTIEAVREPVVATKQEKQVLPAKKELPELTLESLRDTWSEHSAMSASVSVNEDDYYPVLTDVVDVDEEELSEANTADLG